MSKMLDPFYIRPFAPRSRDGRLDLGPAPMESNPGSWTSAVTRRCGSGGGEDPGLPCDGLRTATFTSRMCIGRIGSIKLRFVSGQRRRGEPSLPSMRDAPLPEGRHRARMAPASPGSQQVTRAARRVDRAGRHRGRRHPPEAPRPPPSRPGHRTARAHLSVSAPLQIVFRRTSSARVACLRRKARARLPAPPSER